MISTPYDHIATEFAAARNQFRAKELAYVDELLGPLSPGSTVLDLGCGTGHPIATHIVSLGHAVVGVDGSAAMLALARERLPNQRWIHQRIEAVTFDETFDAVVCWDVLFHLPRRHFAPVIRNIHQWLRPGGRLLVSSGGLVEGDEGFVDTMFGHEFFYDSLSPDHMVRLIEDSGFDILRAEMCDEPAGGRNRGKWMTMASKRTEEARRR